MRSTRSTQSGTGKGCHSKGRLRQPSTEAVSGKRLSDLIHDRQMKITRTGKRPACPFSGGSEEIEIHARRNTASVTVQPLQVTHQRTEKPCRSLLKRMLQGLRLLAEKHPAADHGGLFWISNICPMKGRSHDAIIKGDALPSFMANGPCRLSRWHWPVTRSRATSRRYETLASEQNCGMRGGIHTASPVCPEQTA